MAGSSFSGGSFTPLGDDGTQGLRGYIARLDTTTNASGLATANPPGAAYTGATVQNRSVSSYVRAEVVFAPPFTVVPGDDVQLVAPGATQSFSFDADVIENIRVQAVATPAPGTVTDAGALAPAITGVVDVVINFTNA